MTHNTWGKKETAENEKKFKLSGRGLYGGYRKRLFPFFR